MDLFVTIIITILIFGLLVFVHELGHFIVAIKSGVHVEEFAFGFGPSLYTKIWKGVKYKINLLPFGGYVKMLGDMDGSSFRRYDLKDLTKSDKELVKKWLGKKGLDNPDSNYREVVDYIESLGKEIPDDEYKRLENYVVDYFVPNHPKNFDNKSISKRLAILLAGVFMNFVLGSILFYVLFAFSDYTVDLTKIGEPKFIGAQISDPPIIYEVYKEEYQPYRESLILEYDGEVIVSREQLDALIIKNFNKSAPIKLQTIDGDIDTEIILSGEGIYTNFDEEVRDKVLLLNVLEDSAADKAGISDGDIILSLNNTTLSNPDELRKLLDSNRGKEVSAEIISKDGLIKTITVSLPNPTEDEPILGAFPVLNSPYYENAIRVTYKNNKLLSGFLHSTNLIVYNITAMGQFIGDAFEEKSIEPVFSKVNSVVAIVDVTFYFVKANNFISILNLVAMLSVILAFMNILPIPLFDGGHILFLVIEKIRGKKLSTKTQNRIGQFFFVLLILITIAIVLKDVLQFEWPRRIGKTVMGMLK